MKHDKEEEYLVPEFEVVAVEVEHGFSGSQLPEYKEDDDHITLG